MRKLLRIGKILVPRGADDVLHGGQGRQRRVGSEWRVVSSGRKRRDGVAGRRGGNFRISAGTKATMGKGSAGVLER